VLDCIYDTVNALLRGQVEAATMIDNLELVLLTIDEVGYIRHARRTNHTRHTLSVHFPCTYTHRHVHMYMHPHMHMHMHLLPLYDITPMAPPPNP